MQDPVPIGGLAKGSIPLCDVDRNRRQVVEDTGQSGGEPDFRQLEPDRQLAEALRPSQAR